MANKEEGIILSEKYGVNATLVKCWLCGKDTGELVLLGKLPNDEKAPPYVIQKGHICKNCEKAMEDGQAILEIEDIPEGKPQPKKS